MNTRRDIHREIENASTHTIAIAIAIHKIYALNCVNNDIMLFTLWEREKEIRFWCIAIPSHSLGQIMNVNGTLLHASNSRLNRMSGQQRKRDKSKWRGDYSYDTQIFLRYSFRFYHFCCVEYL